MPGRNISQIDVVDVLRFAESVYGNLENPDYRTVAKVVQKGMSPAMLVPLTRCFWVRDFTQANTDVAFFLDLADFERRFMLIVSCVGPFFHILEYRDQSISNYQNESPNFAFPTAEDACVLRVNKLLGDEYQYVEIALASARVPFDPFHFREATVPLYKVIFTFDQDLGWLS